MEYERARLAGVGLDCLGVLALYFEQLPEFRCDGEDTGFAALYLAGVDRHGTASHVHVAPLEGPRFGFPAPAGRVTEARQRRDLLREVLADPLEIGMLEKAGSRLRLWQHFDVRTPMDLPRSSCYPDMPTYFALIGSK